MILIRNFNNIVQILLIISVILVCRCTNSVLLGKLGESREK